MLKKIIVSFFIGLISSVTMATEKIVTIDGMTCESCAQSITAMLKNVEGVKSSKVSFQEKTASIDIEDGKSLSNDDITQRINKLGYKVTRIVDKAN